MLLLFGMNTSQELLEENEEDTQDTAPDIPVTDSEEEGSCVECISSNSASVGDNKLMLVEKQKAKSAVWSVFGYKPDATGRPSNENKPTCKLCYMEVAVKGGNTTNLFSHLKHKHPKEYSELKLKDPKQCKQAVIVAIINPLYSKLLFIRINIPKLLNVGKNLLILLLSA